MKLLLCVVVVCAGSIGLECCIASRERGAFAPAGIRFSTPWDGAPMLDEIEAAARAKLGSGPAAPSSGPRCALDWKARPHRLGYAPADDASAIARDVEDRSKTRTITRRALAFVRRGQLGTMRLESDGTRVAIPFAPASAASPRELAVDGKRSTREFFEGLAQIDLELRQPSARMSERSLASRGMLATATLSCGRSRLPNGSAHGRAEAIQWFEHAALATGASGEDRTLGWTKALRPVRSKEAVSERPR